jgi:hypothetical protein
MPTGADGGYSRPVSCLWLKGKWRACSPGIDHPHNIKITMFTVPYFHFIIEDWSELKEEILSGLYVKNPERIPIQERETKITDYWDNFNLEKYSKFISLILPYLNKTTNNPNISKIWFQTTSKNQYHGAHTHGAIGWSSIFYATYNPEVHYSTTFYCPFFDVNGNMEYFSPNVDEGHLIVFPSFILHEAPVNNSYAPRTIISCNFF